MKRITTLKKAAAALLSLCLSISSLNVFAKPGDVFTFTKFTNIIAYINHFAIQSYNVNNTTCVCAEDLGNFGFAVTWDPDARSLHIVRNAWTNDIEQYSVPYETDPKVLGMDDSPVYETDIKTYLNGVEVVSYNIGGKTVIDFESLSAFGKVEWHPDLRALKLWVEDGLEMSPYMQELKKLPRKTLYSADGRTITVLENEVNDYLNVGWYTEDMYNAYLQAEQEKEVLLNPISAPFDTLAEMKQATYNTGNCYMKGNFYVGKNSANGVFLHWAAKNRTNKTIKYLTFTVEFYNAVEDLTAEEITNKTSKTLKLTGPIKPQEAFYIKDIIGYSVDCQSVKITEMKIDYMDGTSSSIYYGYKTERYRPGVAF